MSDKHFLCKDCANDFVFKEEEQRFFAEKGFNDPVRCPSCRKKRKEQKMREGR